MRVDELGDLMTPGEVAALFRVDPKTVARWAATGQLPSVRTPGGHHRYRKRDIEQYFQDGGAHERAQGAAQDRERREEDQGPPAAGER